MATTKIKSVTIAFLHGIDYEIEVPPYLKKAGKITETDRVVGYGSLLSGYSQHIIEFSHKDPQASRDSYLIFLESIVEYNIQRIISKMKGRFTAEDYLHGYPDMLYQLTRLMNNIEKLYPPFRQNDLHQTYQEELDGAYFRFYSSYVPLTDNKMKTLIDATRDHTVIKTIKNSIHDYVRFNTEDIVQPNKNIKHYENIA